MIDYNKENLYNDTIFLREVKESYEDLFLYETFLDGLKDASGGFVDAFASFIGIICKSFKDINTDMMRKKIAKYDKEYLADHPDQEMVKKN